MNKEKKLAQVFHFDLQGKRGASPSTRTKTESLKFKYLRPFWFDNILKYMTVYY